MSCLLKILTRNASPDVQTTVKQMLLPLPNGSVEVHSNTVIMFITSNVRKLEEVRTILAPDFPFQILNMHLDLDEIQDPDSDRIAARKCCEAVARLDGKARILIEDTSLVFHALNGLPGPYVKWFEKSVGNAGMARLLTGFEDKSATVIATLTFWDGKQIMLFRGETEGRIVEPRGPSTSFGWDPIFMPNGSDQTFAEMGPEAKNKISHRTKAVNLFKDYVTNVLNAG